MLRGPELVGGAIEERMHEEDGLKDRTDKQKLSRSWRGPRRAAGRGGLPCARSFIANSAVYGGRGAKLNEDWDKIRD